MWGWCLQAASVMSQAHSSPPSLDTWPGWESVGDATCCCGRTGWWQEDYYLELWSSCVFVLHCWLVCIPKHTPSDVQSITYSHSSINPSQHLDPVSWIWMAWEAANHSPVSFVTAVLPNGRLLVKRIEGDVTEEDPPKPSSSNDTRLHSAGYNIPTHSRRDMISAHSFQRLNAIC